MTAESDDIFIEEQHDNDRRHRKQRKRVFAESRLVIFKNSLCLDRSDELTKLTGLLFSDLLLLYLILRYGFFHIRAESVGIFLAHCLFKLVLHAEGKHEVGISLVKSVGIGGAVFLGGCGNCFAGKVFGVPDDLSGFAGFVSGKLRHIFLFRCRQLRRCGLFRNVVQAEHHSLVSVVYGFFRSGGCGLSFGGFGCGLVSGFGVKHDSIARPGRVRNLRRISGASGHFGGVAFAGNIADLSSLAECRKQLGIRRGISTGTVGHGVFIFCGRGQRIDEFVLLHPGNAFPGELFVLVLRKIFLHKRVDIEVGYLRFRHGTDKSGVRLRHFALYLFLGDGRSGFFGFPEPVSLFAVTGLCSAVLHVCLQLGKQFVSGYVIVVLISHLSFLLTVVVTSVSVLRLR